ncbi:MAG: DUF4365 domain-containing protein [Phycisphaerae bacterium]
MKHTEQSVTAKAGVIFVTKVVNEHGSIFHPVHQENDLGVDGFIEIVKGAESSCRLVATQVKSGDSYLASTGNEFAISVDDQHLDYWLGFTVPVIIVAYSPTRKAAAWVSVRDYVEQERYHDRLPVKQIRIPLSKKFDTDALSKGVAGLAHARADERLLIQFADKCLSRNRLERHAAFQALAFHPDSSRLRITCLLARRLLRDDSADTAKDALYVLGFDVGRERWSCNPNNPVESDQSRFAAEICNDLKEDEIRRLLEICDDEAFHGPQGLGERLFDVICCCFDSAQRVLDCVARDPTQPMQRRANALYLLFQCDEVELAAAKGDLRSNRDLADLVDWMFL